MIKSPIKILAVAVFFITISLPILSFAESDTVAETTSGTVNISAQSGDGYQAQYLPPALREVPQTPGGLVVGIYKYALGIVGLLAVGIIIYAGYLRMVGNVKGSNDYIISALYGILLLAGAYLILYTINPDIVDIPKIDEKLAPTGLQIRDPGAFLRAGLSVLGTSIAEKCDGCVMTKDATTGSTFVVKPSACAGGFTNCQMKPDMVAKLNTMQSILKNQGINWQVTEGYPPTTAHKDGCHANATCVDAAVVGSLNQQKVGVFIQAAKQAGFKVGNEYSQYGGKTYDTTTGSHLHLSLQ